MPGYVYRVIRVIRVFRVIRVTLYERVVGPVEGVQQVFPSIALPLRVSTQHLHTCIDAYTEREDDGADDI